jgi:hypothetical protein
MLSETLLTLRTEQNIFINIHTSTFKLSVILVRLIKLEFSRQIFLKTHIPNFMKICPVGTELFYADGHADMTKQTVYLS